MSSCSIRTELDVQALLELRGLGSDHRAWRRAGELVRDYCADYAPWQTGNLALGSVVVDASAAGAEVRYTAPYAHYQYYGRVMGPNVLTKQGWRSMAPRGGKYYTGRALKYAGGRSGYWDRRMLAARGGELLQALADYVGGTVK